MFGTILVVNELGLGNATLALPFLDALARSVCSGVIWHVESPLLEEPELRERFRIRSVPARWAFASFADHEAILRFCEDERIELFVNLRNEDFGLPFNAGYEPLRTRLHERGIAVWDLFDRPDETRHRHIAEQWIRLFEGHRVSVDASVSRGILETLGEAGQTADRVGILLAASRRDKRVALPIVRRIVESLLLEDIRVRVIGGIGEDELREVAELRASLNDDRVEFTVPGNVRALISELRSLRALVCNDTFGMHCAVALGIPTVALFSTTRRLVWGPPDSDRFRGISSAVCAACPWMPAQGFCYVSARCAGVPNEGFIAGEVVEAVQRLLTPSRPA